MLSNSRFLRCHCELLISGLNLIEPLFLWYRECGDRSLKFIYCVSKKRKLTEILMLVASCYNYRQFLSLYTSSLLYYRTFYQFLILLQYLTLVWLHLEYAALSHLSNDTMQ